MSSMSKKNFGLSSSLEEEVMVIKKQGIVSILGYSADSNKTKAASLRRTLSADMSSQKWLSQHGFSPLKKIASSEELPVFSSEEDESENRGQFEIWNSIQHQQNEKQKHTPGQFDIWSSIVSDRQECTNNNNVPPYVHPLVKRSASSLSEKSLQICTESLGSETGSDGFSSYPPSETEDEQHGPEDEEDDVKQAERFEDSVFPVEKYTKKITPPRSFPPPLPLLSRGDGASLHMRPRRDNGRLVLEAVTVPSQSNFRAERQDGRLVLTFVNNEEQGEEGATKSEEKIRDSGLFQVDVESEEEEEGTESETETDAEEVRISVPKLGGGVMNVHRLALMMNKSVVLANRNPTWSNKFNNEEEREDEVQNPIAALTQSLPPRPAVGMMISMTTATTVKAAGAGAGSLNAYEYHWRAKPAAATTGAVLISPIAQNPTLSKNKIASNGKQELVVLRGKKGDNYFIPLSSKGCKQPRRSLFFWEPYCIATS